MKKSNDHEEVKWISEMTDHTSLMVNCSQREWYDKEWAHSEVETNMPFLKVYVTMEFQPIIFTWAYGSNMARSSHLFMRK